jgi:hypothetical protein
MKGKEKLLLVALGVVGAYFAYKYFTRATSSTSSALSASGYSADEAEALSNEKLPNGDSLYVAAQTLYDYIYAGGVIFGGVLSLLDTQSRRACFEYLKRNVADPSVYNRLALVYKIYKEDKWLHDKKSLTENLYNYLDSSDFVNLHYLHLS